MRIVKENGVLTEQTLEIVVQLVPLSAFGDAERGKHFSIVYNYFLLHSLFDASGARLAGSKWAAMAVILIKHANIID